MAIQRLKDPKQIMSLGMMFLPAGLVSLRYLHRLTNLPEDLSDGIAGLFMGLAIGLTLLGVWLNGRQGRNRA
ncbi:MAG: hypothetical protein ABI837_16495 [Acidobacteriota bacterium]